MSHSSICICWHFLSCQTLHFQIHFRITSSINTFAFLDLETTGLPQSHKETRITEIALVCVDRDNLQNATTNGLPRVLHKLCLPVNPGILVEYGAFMTTGGQIQNCHL